MIERIFTNAQIVMADSVIRGSMSIIGNRIGRIDEGACSLASAIDCGGAYVIPGLVELHTDNIERHLNPRPNCWWPSGAAIVSHDREIAGVGITTVFDALSVGHADKASRSAERLKESCDAISAAREDGALKADHFLHLRCEVSGPEMTGLFDTLIDNPLARLVSVMDHTPGQRQFTTFESFRAYYQVKYKMSDTEFDAFVEARVAEQLQYGEVNRRHVVASARARNIPVASHDDATAAHVAEAIADGVSIAEFPTTPEAAKVSHEAGLAVLMGGPNIVRGKSHSGNASARDFARSGYLDIISSDYMPASLLHAALVLEQEVEHITLPQAIAMVTKNPAERAGLTDRGEIAPGKLVDFVIFRHDASAPVIQEVWRHGQRIT